MDEKIRVLPAPVGDSPTSCKLFDIIQNLYIPVIVSDNIELPFEGMVDYSEFSIFVGVSDALRPSWLVGHHLKSFSKQQKDRFRQNMALLQTMVKFDDCHAGGIGPIPLDSAVNYIWWKVHQKLPMIKEATDREKIQQHCVSVPCKNEKEEGSNETYLKDCCSLFISYKMLCNA